MLIWYVKEDFIHNVEKYKKGHYLITANYREPWFRNGGYPVEVVGKFQAYWGARPCVVYLSQEEIKEWITDVIGNAKKINNKIDKIKRRGN